MTHVLYPSQFEGRLKVYRLSGMARTIAARLKEAEVKNLTHAEFVALLCEDEDTARADNKRRKLYKGARLPSEKGLEDFNFAFQPSLSRQDILELASCEYLKEHRNILFLGQTGTGKTHLSVALALMALGQEKTVLFTTVWEMINKLQQARADLTYGKKIKTYLKPDLLILDELGYRSLDKTTGEDFYEIISGRYEKGSIIITTNRPVEEWDKVFIDKRLTEAIADRFTHHLSKVAITGESWRHKHRD